MQCYEDIDYDKSLNFVHSGKGVNLALGRNVAAGNFRGWHLDYGNLKSWLRMDPLYSAALDNIKGLSLIAEAKLMNIFLILKYGISSISNKGYIIEFGSYKGGSSIFMAYIASKILPSVHIYALDTYEGMPISKPELDIHKEGDFSDSNLESFKDKIKALNLNNITPVKGLFQETLPKLPIEPGTLLLSHIDCDIYDSVKYAIDSSLNIMKSGSYLIFDDPLLASCLGALQAVEDTLGKKGYHAEQAAPHLVYRYF